MELVRMFIYYFSIKMYYIEKDQFHFVNLTYPVKMWVFNRSIKKGPLDNYGN